MIRLIGLFEALKARHDFNVLHASDVEAFGKLYNTNAFAFCKKWGILYKVDGWKKSDDKISWELEE